MAQPQTVKRTPPPDRMYQPAIHCHQQIQEYHGLGHLVCHVSTGCEGSKRAYIGIAEDKGALPAG